MKLSADRLWNLGLALTAVASIVPLFCASHLPMADLPEHLASMATIRHYHDPSWHGSDHFVIAGPLTTPYWLYHAVGALLSLALGSAQRANLLLLAGVGLAYPYALRALLVALGRDRRLAFFGCALFWSMNLALGLLNFVASVPFVLFGVALAIREAETPRARRAIGLAALSTALFYLHVSSWGLFLVDVVLVTWLLPVPSPTTGLVRALVARLVSLPRRLVWLVPSLSFAGLVAIAGRTVDRGAGPTATWHPRAELFLRAPGWLFDVFVTPIDDVVGVVLFVALAALAIFARRRSRGVAAAWRSKIAGLLFLVALAVFAASPSTIGKAAFLLDIRMAVFVAFFAIVVPDVEDGVAARRLFAIVATATLVLSATTAREFRGFERDDVAGFDELLRGMPRGKRLLMLSFQPTSTHVNARVMPYFGSYYRARHGGIASFSFSEMSHWPTQYRPGAAPPLASAWGNPCMFRNGRDGAYFDYILTRGDQDPFANATAGPTWELVGGARAWRLYRKTGKRLDGDGEDLGPCS